MEDVGQVEGSEAGKTDILRLKLLSLSLTEAHGDPKTYEKNVHETMANFPKLREERLADFASVFKLVDVNDTARARRHKVLTFFRANMTRENLHHASEVHESSHQCLILIDELRELMDRLISWLTMCLPANDHPLSVSHRRKLKLFQKRLAQEAVRLEQRRSTVSSAHSIRVNTIRSMLRAKDVSDADVPAWETAHHHLLTMQETETYLSMCRVWLNTLDSALLIFNYWKVNLKDDSIAFGTGETSSGKHDYFYA